MNRRTGVTTEIGTTTVQGIQVRGLSLADDILGKLDFVDMLSWLTLGRLPSQQQKNMLNLLLVTAADHGLTPSALSARLTYLGAPESLQGAVASGLLGAGSRFLGTVQNAAELLMTGAEGLTEEPQESEIDAAAKRIVEAAMQGKRSLPGWGHPLHVNGDPRVPILMAVSIENGCFGRHWRLAQAIGSAISGIRGHTLPLNAAGAIGAIVADMGLDPLFGRGLALIARTAGIVAHILEERDRPIAGELWNLVLAQDARNELPSRG